jgi:hypothetical protein
MKGFFKKTVVMLGWAGALAGTVGWNHQYDVVDPCYPERYEYLSRQEVHDALTPQVRNGHVLDQTVWNYHFEEMTDRLTPGGQEHLKYLARRRPMPDPMIFVQTSEDVPYVQDRSEDFPARRAALDQKRVDAVRRYLIAQTAGGQPVPFEVMVHNPPDPGIAGAATEQSLKLLYSTPKAVLPGTPGTSISGGGGGGGGGGGR